MQKEVLARFALGPRLFPWVSTLLADVLEYFLVSACTIDKLGSAGKLHLTADLAQVGVEMERGGCGRWARSTLCHARTLTQVEIALDSLAPAAGCPLADLGAPYRALRYGGEKWVLPHDLPRLNLSLCSLPPQRTAAAAVSRACGRVDGARVRDQHPRFVGHPLSLCAGWAERHGIATHHRQQDTFSGPGYPKRFKKRKEDSFLSCPAYSTRLGWSVWTSRPGWPPAKTRWTSTLMKSR